MIILIKLFLNSKLDLIRAFKFVKQLFRIQIKKCGKYYVLWNQVKSRMEACYSEMVRIVRNLLRQQCPEIKIKSYLIAFRPTSPG